MIQELQQKYPHLYFEMRGEDEIRIKVRSNPKKWEFKYLQGKLTTQIVEKYLNEWGYCTIK